MCSQKLFKFGVLLHFSSHSSLRTFPAGSQWTTRSIVNWSGLRVQWLRNSLPTCQLSGKCQRDVMISNPCETIRVCRRWMTQAAGSHINMKTARQSVPLLWQYTAKCSFQMYIPGISTGHAHKHTKQGEIHAPLCLRLEINIISVMWTFNLAF